MSAEPDNTDVSRKLFRWAIGYLHHHIPSNDDITLYGFSRVVNYAFACELLIKSHLTRESEPSGGHELKVLFNQLDGSTQAMIGKILNEQFQGKIYKTEDFRHYPKI